MKKHLQFGILLSLSLIFISSCVEDVVLNTEDEYEICLNYIMSNEEVQTLNLCWTKGNSDSEYTPITEAEVNLYLKKGNDSTLVGQFSHIDSTEWRLNYSPIPMSEYSIIVKTGESSVYAHTRMPGKIEKKYLGKFDIPPKVLYYVSLEAKLECVEDCVIWLSVYTNRGYKLDTLCISISDMNIDSINRFEVDRLDFAYHHFIRFNYAPSYRTSYNIPFDKYIPSPTNQNEWSDLELSIDDNGNICGPCINIFPRSINFNKNTLINHIYSVSKEYDAFLKTNIEYKEALYMVKRDEIFTSKYKYYSPYTNITNGRGIFGASYKLISDGYWNCE